MAPRGKSETFPLIQFILDKNAPVTSFITCGRLSLPNLLRGAFPVVVSQKEWAKSLHSLVTIPLTGIIPALCSDRNRGVK